MTDFHGYSRKLEPYLKRLETEGFSKQDQRLIKGFLDYSQALGVSQGRLFKLAWTLFAIRRNLGVDFRKAKREEIQRMIAMLNASGKYSAWSRSDFAKIVKRFYKYVRNGNCDKSEPFPPEVAWIPTSIKKNEVREPEIITEKRRLRCNCLFLSVRNSGQ